MLRSLEPEVSDANSVHDHDRHFTKRAKIHENQNATLDNTSAITSPATPTSSLPRSLLTPGIPTMAIDGPKVIPNTPTIPNTQNVQTRYVWTLPKPALNPLDVVCKKISTLQKPPMPVNKNDNRLQNKPRQPPARRIPIIKNKQIVKHLPRPPALPFGGVVASKKSSCYTAVVPRKVCVTVIYILCLGGKFSQKAQPSSIKLASPKQINNVSYEFHIFGSDPTLLSSRSSNFVEKLQKSIVTKRTGSYQLPKLAKEADARMYTIPIQYTEQQDSQQQQHQQPKSIQVSTHYHLCSSSASSKTAMTIQITKFIVEMAAMLAVRNSQSARTVERCDIVFVGPDTNQLKRLMQNNSEINGCSNLDKIEEEGNSKSGLDILASLSTQSKQTVETNSARENDFDDLMALANSYSNVNLKGRSIEGSDLKILSAMYDFDIFGGVVSQSI